MGALGLAALLVVAAGAGHPTPTADTLANGIPRACVPALKPWVAMWRAAIPGFGIDSLVRSGRTPAFRRGTVVPWSQIWPPPPEQESAYAILSARSPDRRHLLVFDWYAAVTEDSGKVDIGGEPDSSPLLVDLRAGTSNQFEFCGTDCSYEWGRWIDTEHFVLAGSSRSDEPGGPARGFLAFYSITDSNKVSYLTSPVRLERFAKYEAAWQRWVTAHYRAWKSSRAKR